MPLPQVLVAGAFGYAAVVEKKVIDHGPPADWWSTGAASDEGGAHHPKNDRAGRGFVFGSAAVLLPAMWLGFARYHVVAVVLLMVSFAIAVVGIRLSPRLGSAPPVIMLTMVVVVLASLGLFVYLGLGIMLFMGTPVFGTS